MNLEDLTLVQASSQIREGRLSPVEYLKALLNRIDKLEPHILAWVTINRENALKEAHACEAEAKSGRFRGPLHGVPIGVKDIFCTKGLRTTAGSRFLQDFVPDHDAEAVTQLRRAGAVILGKTVTTEFATFDPGPTRNPHNPAHTPGGSSSGSAAAVAARMCPAATGSQTVASIGRPAAYCGVVGIVPTQARVSRSGVFPVSWSLDHIGGFGRRVADAKLMLEALSGESLPNAAVKKPIRMGVLRGLFESKASPETRDLHESFLKKLDSQTFALEEARMPAIFEIQSSILMTIFRAEVAAIHAAFYRDHSTSYSDKLRALVETGMLLEARSYLLAMRLRKVYQRELARLFQEFDVLITPGATGTAPEGLGYTGDPSFSGPWALADFPTLTVPHARASNGLPVAVQISAAPMNESTLFAVGELLEG
jgi:Asp-tRNA(Asn)/Glu-tRNA(Gln) amidotransferase A subunit family amidase